MVSVGFRFILSLLFQISLGAIEVSGKTGKPMFSGIYVGICAIVELSSSELGWYDVY